MKQLRSKKRSQQWIAVLLAVVMVVGHMAMASAYDPNAGGEEYINAPLLDLTNGGSGADASGIGDGSGTGGNGVQGGSSDGEFIFDPYSNTITGADGESLPQDGDGEEEEFILNPDTFGETIVADDYDIHFEVLPEDHIFENGEIAEVVLTIYSKGGEKSKIPAGVKVELGFPSYIPEEELRKAAAELASDARRNVIQNNFTVTGGPGERKTLTMFTNEVTGDNAWMLELYLALRIDKFYYNGDESVTITVGNTVITGEIHVDRHVEGDFAVRKELLNASKEKGNMFIDGPVGKYMVTINIPQMHNDVTEEEGGRSRVTIRDEIQNSKFMISTQDGIFDAAKIEEDIRGYIVDGFMASLPGMTEAEASAMIHSFTFIPAGSDTPSGFEVELIGETDGPVQLQLYYFFTLIDPNADISNEYVRNEAVVTYGKLEKKSDVTVLLNSSAAALWRKRIDDNKFEMLLDESGELALPTSGTADVDFEFLITALGKPSVLKGQIILDDYLDPEFMYKESSFHSGSMEDHAGISDGTFQTPENIIIGVYGDKLDPDNRVVRISPNSTGKLNDEFYNVTFTTQMDLGKILPGQSGKNRVSDDVVYVYRSAELEIGKRWQTATGDDVKSDVKFSLYNENGDLIGEDTLVYDAQNPNATAKIRFSYLDEGILDDVNAYTLREKLLDEEGSTYATAEPITIYIDKYTEGEKGDIRGVRFTDSAGTPIGEYYGLRYVEVENPYDDGLGKIAFAKYGRTRQDLSFPLDGAEFTIHMGVALDANDKPTAVDESNLLPVNVDGTNGVYTFKDVGGEGSVITTYDGIASISELPYKVTDGLVTYDTYVIREKTPPENYSYDADKTLYFKLGKNNKNDVDTTNPTGNFFLNVFQQDGSISILKVDEDGEALSGARFRITKGSYVNGKFEAGDFVKELPTRTADKVSEFSFTGLENGVYMIEEIKWPDGYMGFNGAIYVTISHDGEVTLDNVTINVDGTTNATAELKGKTIKLSWVNEERFGFIEFIKYRGDIIRSAPEAKLEGAKFQLYKSNSTYETQEAYLVNGVELVAESDEFGVVRFSDLPFGYYIVMELDPGDDDYFIPGPNMSIHFAIVEDEGRAPVIVDGLLKGSCVNSVLEGEYADKYYLSNPKRGRIEFYKIDWDIPTITLAGAKFELFKFIDGEGFSETALMTFITQADGRVYFEGLEYGTYRVKETGAPTNGEYYVDPANPPYVDFIVNSPHTAQHDQTKVFEHLVYSGARYNWLNPKLGKLEFTKVDSHYDPLSGAEFKLQYETAPNIWADYNTDTVTTDATGIVSFDKLPHGRYRVVEVGSPDGYIDNVTPVIFIVGRTTTTDPVNALEVIEGVRYWKNLRFGHLEFYKAEKGNNENVLGGAEFELYKVTLNSSGVETYRSSQIGETKASDPDGKVRFDKLEHGTYVVIETKAPSGYELPESNPKKYFEVGESFSPIQVNGTVILSSSDNSYYWPNTPKLGKLTVYKYDITDPVNPLSEEYMLDGVQFQLFRVNASNNPIWWSNPVTVYNGIAEFTGLEAGTYYLLETWVGEEYAKAEAHSTVPKALENPIVIGPGTEDEWIIELPVFNPRELRTVTLIKGDETAAGVLEGAAFTLRGNNALNGVTYEKTVESGSDGKVTFTNVPFGRYTLTETKPYDGYAPIVPITNIVVDDSVDETLGLELGRINNYPYELIVTKSDLETEGEEKVYLAGAKFQIYVEDENGARYVKALEATTPSGLNAYEFEELVDQADATTFVTGSDGKFTVNKMVYGKYLIKEVEPPEGYVLIDEPKEAVFDKQSSSGKVSVEVDVPNGAVYGGIEITKIDGENKGALEGVVFTLKRQGAGDGTEIELVTDEYGKASADNLIYGLYELREKKSARGYKAKLTDAVDDVLLIDIKKHNEVVKVGPLNNFPVVGNVELTKLGSTLDNVDVPLPGAQFLIKPIELTWDEQSGEIIQARVSEDEGDFRYTMSGPDGKVAFKNLAYGAYIIEENIAPDGYDKSESKPYAVVHVGLSAEEFENLEDWMEANYAGFNDLRFVFDTVGMTWINHVVTGSLSFLKQDGNGTNIDGALFELYMVQGDGEEIPVTLTKDAVRKGVFAYEGLNGVATQIDTGSGEGSVSGLPYGRYILREIEAPENRMIVKADHEVFIYSGNKEVSLIIENPEIEGRLRVIKKDADSDYIFLSGAEVSVYQRKADGKPGEYIDKVVTQIGGTGELGGLKLGEYIAVETKAPDGYTLNDSPGHSFDITAKNIEQVVELVFENTKKSYSLRILKVERAENGELVPIEVKGAQFQVEHPASNGYWYPITNDKGVAELKGIPAGDYTILEAMAPKGYIRDTAIRNVTVNDDEATVVIEVINERIMGGVRIRKLDQDGEALNNAKFELYKDGQTVPMKLTQMVNGSYEPDESGAVTEITVGEATISGLEAGTYKLVETQVPAGYIMPDEARTFTVSETTHNELIEVDIVNIKAEASFAIRKVDADDSTLRLQGATFQLFRANTLGVYEYVRSRTTDSTGYAVFSSLAPGSYRVDEVTAPAGYRLWNTPLYFEVTDDLKVAIGSNEYTMIDGVVIATVVNHKSNQYFQVRKVNADTGSVLQNARFSLTGSGANSSYYSVLTSGASGLTERVSLPAGTYYLQEMAAPSGYQRTTATFTVVVDEDGVLVNGTRLSGPSVFTYEMPNTPERRTALLYKTDSTSRQPLAGAVFSITQRGTGNAWTLSTNSSGRTGNFTLTPGYTYDIVETTTPSGYNRPMQGWTVSVSSSGAISASGRGIVAYSDSGITVINIENTRTTTTTTTTTTPTPTPRATSTSTSTSTRTTTTASSTSVRASTDEEPIPLGPGLPRTGQYTNVGLLILGAVIMVISCAALMLYVLKSRKEREEGYGVF